MPTAMFTACCDWVAGNNQRELEAPLESWPRSSKTSLPEATPTVARYRAPSSSPLPRHYRGVVAIRASGANGRCSAGSRTSADRDSAAVARMMDDDLDRGGISLVGAWLKKDVSILRFAAECADLDNIGQVTSRWTFASCLINTFPLAGVTVEQPLIPIRAAVKLSSPGPLASPRFVLAAVTPGPLPRNPGMPCRTHLPAGTPLNCVGFVDKFDGPDP